MQDNDRHLNVDLTFLDSKSGPSGTAAVVDTGYKTNWRNISIIAGIVIVVGYLIFTSNQPSPLGTGGNSSYSYGTPSPAPTGGSADTAPVDQSQSTGNGGVTNDQFRCSSEDSAEADRLGATESESQLESDKSALEARSNELQELKAQIDADPVDQNSSQADIDSHNGKIDSYNAQLNSLKSDEASLQQRMDAFNAAVQAHNSYLNSIAPEMDNKMTVASKPLLHGGFVITSGVSVVRRLESVFFTEVYELSNRAYFYLFVKVKPEDVAGREEKYGLRRITVAGHIYLGLIVPEHSREKVFALAESISSVRGFDAVAGMQELKKRLINDVINPLRNPERYRQFKLSIPNGILLYGPPGCGKTFIVKKLAEELGYGFVELSPSSVATPYVHGAVGNIASVFEMARREAPAIIFIDEIEGLLPKREELSGSADIKKEEINEFLLQLNNAGDSRILVIGATNRPQMIDTAILRSGRMDKRIFVPPPDYDARKEMFRICLGGRPYDDTIDFDALARATENFVGSDIELIVTEAARAAVLGEKARIDEHMITGVIARFPPSISPDEIGQYKQFTNLERW